MKFSTVKLFSEQVRTNIIRRPSTRWLIAIFNVLLFFALFSKYHHLVQKQKTTDTYSHEVRHLWENNPDKHPHRMAHYGYVVFRQKFPLSFFDLGIDNYLGNAVFLEAHKQNSVNFSEASLSNALLRFGEISAAMVLQLLLPLLIFFWGFDLVSKEREQGTLQLLFSQEITWQELILGKTIGLFSLTLTIFLPVVIVSFILLAANGLAREIPEVFLRFSLLTFAYLIYFFILALISVLISASSKTSKSSLIQLIGCWLLFSLILPKIFQVYGQMYHPSPSRVEFETAVEEELIQQGDSHNPDDPHYQALKDSLLLAYGVDSTHQLPFNYSGFVMKEGERLSAQTYQKHHTQLVEIFKTQQNILRTSAFLNPYMAIRNLSMAFSGTDYASYHHFQNQAEDYRYLLAQTMNNLQIEFISNRVTSSADKSAIISQQHWRDFPDFEHRFLSISQVLKHEVLSIASILLWILGLLFLLKTTDKRLKVL